MKKASHKNDEIGFGEYEELDQACMVTVFCITDFCSCTIIYI